MYYIMAKKYKQGRFVPINKEKYVGDIDNIVYRSGWERQFLKYCDENPAIIQYNSEDVKIKYISPLDNKMHTYWIDFYLKIKSSDGSIKQMLIEVKPHAETIEPKRGKKRQKTYLREVTTYVRNQAKWKYARAFAKSKGCEFIVLTEVMMPQLLRG